jgi:hypothetical protein
MTKNHLAQPLRAPHDLRMASKRPHVLSVTLSADELAQFQAMAKAADMPMTNMVRGWFREKLAKQVKRQG